MRWLVGGGGGGWCATEKSLVQNLTELYLIFKVVLRIGEIIRIAQTKDL